MLIVLGLAALAAVPGRAGYYCYSWLALAGKLDRLAYLDYATEEAYLPAVDAVATHTPRDARIMLLSVHRILYVPRECGIGTPLFQERYFSPVDQYADPNRIMATMEKNRFTHMLIAKSRVGPDYAREAENQWQEFLQTVERWVPESRLQVVWNSEQSVLLEAHW